MTSQSKPPAWRRPSKTHGTFENIPSLRVSGKDIHSNSASSRKTSTPKKPIQYADPTLFPGRRLDRRQASTYSGVSGHSGLSGLDQLTLHSSNRMRAAAGSTAGSTKLSHASLPSLNRPFLPDGTDPWSSARQIAREDSPLTMLRKQVVEAEEEGKVSLANAFPLPPPQSSISKVSRWQQANFTQSINRPPSVERREPLMESPDSLESLESDLQPPINHELLLQRELRRKEQQEREVRQQRDMQHRRRLTPPPPSLDPTLPSMQPRGMRHLNPHRRPANTPAVSPKPGSGSGPQLNKILWALVPDEHANTSEAALSQKQPSCRDTNATGENHNTGRFVTLTDLDGAGSDESRHVPDTTRNPMLTEQLLSNYNESGSWSRDDRIFQWLAECDQETTSQSLPTHLPDIKYTFKYLKSAT